MTVQLTHSRHLGTAWLCIEGLLTSVLFYFFYFFPHRERQRCGSLTYTVLKGEGAGERTGDVPCTTACFCAFFPDVRSSSTRKQHLSQTMSNSMLKIDSVLTGTFMTGNCRALLVYLNPPTLIF